MEKCQVDVYQVVEEERKKKHILRNHMSNYNNLKRIHLNI